MFSIARQVKRRATITAFLVTPRIKNSDGIVIAQNFSQSSFADPGLTGVPDIKLLGGEVDGSFIIPFMSNKTRSDDVNQKALFAFSNIYPRPIQFEWHTKRSDYIGSFGVL